MATTLESLKEVYENRIVALLNRCREACLSRNWATSEIEAGFEELADVHMPVLMRSGPGLEAVPLARRLSVPARQPSRRMKQPPHAGGTATTSASSIMSVVSAVASLTVGLSIFHGGKTTVSQARNRNPYASLIDAEIRRGVLRLRNWQKR
jgi:hypothetical protein